MAAIRFGVGGRAGSVAAGSKSSKGEPNFKTVDPKTMKRSATFSLKKASPWGTVRDEVVELPAEYMIDGIRAFANSNGVFGTRLTGPKLFTGIASIMKSPWNYSAAEICALLKLHRDDGKCPDTWVPDDKVTPPI